MSIYSTSPSVIVSGSNPMLPYINMANPSAGNVRYNGGLTKFEVYDGYNWLQIDNIPVAGISLTPAAEAAIQWAQQKMIEESKIKALCEKFPALQKAKDNFDIIKALVENENIKESV